VVARNECIAMVQKEEWQYERERSGGQADGTFRERKLEGDKKRKDR